MAAARRLALAGAALLVAAPVPGPLARVAVGADGAPIEFRELSTLSGGPLDFGAPVSSLEKATCAFFDADGDGWDDFVSLAGVGVPSLYFLNRPDGNGGRTFVPAPPGNGLDDGAVLDRDGGSITAGDLDGDGDEDLVIGMAWAASLGVGRGRVVLLLNDGDGRFTDVAQGAGIVTGDSTTCATTLFDMDLDGDLDLFTCNTTFAETSKEGDGIAHLWRNELAETGTLHFAEETAARGIVEDGTAVWSATGTDFDGDGWPDLLITHDADGPTQLFRNTGGGNFADITNTVGAGAGDDGTPSTFGDDSYAAMGATWGDIDNDGDLDLYITNIARNPLYRNDGEGHLTEIGERAGVRQSIVTWGTSFADFDLDGLLDLYVAGGDVWDYSRDRVQSYVYRGLGGAAFEDVTAGAHVRHDVPLHRENGTACADFDRDGRVDLLVSRAERSGASPYLYRNESDVAGRHWMSVALRGNGVTSNRSAIGARIRVIPRSADGFGIPGMAQLREVSGGESRGARSSLVQTVGLGADAAWCDVVVRWPRVGSIDARTQTYVGVPPDVLVTIDETPRASPWRPQDGATVTVGDQRRTEFAVPGTTDPDPLSLVEMTSGPGWASAGAWNGARTVVVQPPRTDASAVFAVALRATAQFAAEPLSNATVTVRVVPAPRIVSARRRGTTLELVGDHLDLRGLALTMSGQSLKFAKAKRMKPVLGEPRWRITAPIPKKLRKPKSGAPVEIVDPATGLGSATSV